jgi:hypothetical protein
VLGTSNQPVYILNALNLVPVRSQNVISITLASNRQMYLISITLAPNRSSLTCSATKASTETSNLNTTSNLTENQVSTAFCCEKATTLRAILNFTPGPQGRTSPLGVNLAPRGEICPLEGMFTPLFTPRGEHSLLFRRMEGRRENFTPKGKLHPRGHNSPLGDNFAPGVKVFPKGLS